MDGAPAAVLHRFAPILRESGGQFPRFKEFLVVEFVGSAPRGRDGGSRVAVQMNRDVAPSGKPTSDLLRAPTHHVIAGEQALDQRPPRRRYGLWNGDSLADELEIDRLFAQS